MQSWTSYPKVLALGHAGLTGRIRDEVDIEEKIDGSQFSFGVTEEGEVKVRSRGKELVLDAPEKMFDRACAVVCEMAGDLRPGWTYRAEYLRTPKHNTLAYSRTPEKHLMIFDIAVGLEDYLDYQAKEAEARRLGLECVPLLMHGKLSNFDEIRDMLSRESVLGGQKIEGVVLKNNPREIDRDGKPVVAKYVSEAFKETHRKEWKKSNPSNGDFLQLLAQKYRSEARWDKAVFRLRDNGKLEGSPRDIGALMKEVPLDIRAECEEEIKNALFKWAWPRIQRTATAGLPEWYKERLAESAFEEEGAA